MFPAVLELNSKMRFGMTSRGVPLFRAVPYDSSLSPVVAGCSARDLMKPLVGLFTVEDWDKPYQPGGSYPRATLVRPLGPAGDLVVEQQALLYQYAGNLVGKVPLASASASAPAPKLDVERVLLPKENTFHIDPKGCRDVDDVITVQKIDDLLEITITIADVTEYIPFGSAEEIYAKALGSTFYTPEGSVAQPMLHPALSENTLSLLPGQEHLGLSLCLRYSNSEPPELVEKGWLLTRFHVGRSYTYEEADEELQSPTTLLHTLSEFIQQTTQKPHNSHTLIEFLMLLYNTEAATLLKKHQKGILRRQDQSEREVMEALSAIGAPLHLGQKAAAYCTADADSTSHAALSLAAYTHASSPIRRYVDYYNQCVIKHILFGCPAPPPLTPGLIDHVNVRAKAQKSFSRDLFFLTQLSTKKAETDAALSVSAFCLRESFFYVDAWKRCIRVRPSYTSDPSAVKPQAGHTYVLHWYVDMSQVNWKKRIVFRIE